MPSAGSDHSCVLLQDGTAVAFGCNDHGECDLPVLEVGRAFVQVSAGGGHTVLLRDDGIAVACGDNTCGQCIIPALEGGETYTQVSAGSFCTLLLRSDGAAVYSGYQFYRRIPPALEPGQMYREVCAGCGSTPSHTLLLLNDGSPLLGGDPDRPLLGLFPTLAALGQGRAFGPGEDSSKFTQPSAGKWFGHHMALLREDGRVLALGNNADGQCEIPELEEDVTYTQVSTSGIHTVLLRSDGLAVACGANDDGQCDIPRLEGGVVYTEVSAGGHHTLLLRSDGVVATCGFNGDGRMDVPAGGVVGPSSRARGDLVVQLLWHRDQVDELVWHAVCLDLRGVQLATWGWITGEDDFGPVVYEDTAVRRSVLAALAPVVPIGARRVCIVLPSGRLLTSPTSWTTLMIDPWDPAYDGQAS